ncbi:hypothetical protein OH76DRAFT_1449137 [Lentinus brumalis]|uniref:F-box domain-containing protein n=1 Tax=Lentinus brumalis TaxID=2498619 RepID=A0A371CNL3_9APHY|nr:hypothetical protein OH76DRAFT_1449137 [Polyporus brumalis]
MSLSLVPTELLQAILVFALDDNPCPCKILCVNRRFFELGQSLLHGRLHFYSINQLSLFAAGSAPLACAPRSVAIVLAGGSGDFEVFRHLMGVLKRCQHSRRIASGEVKESPEAHSFSDSESAQVSLDSLSLRLHSHSSNPHLGYIYEALSLANPKTFVWRGPDPEHHFSTAIVPTATYHLICAISTWTVIEHITLTNMSFPSDELGVNTPFSRDAPLLPPLPSLRTLYIGQATLLPPSSVAAMLARPGQDALECVRLVDTYRHSIWGNRIRLRDVEDAVGQLRTIGAEQRAEALRRVRRVVSCEKKTERTQGGDNGDVVGILT